MGGAKRHSSEEAASDADSDFANGDNKEGGRGDLPGSLEPTSSDPARSHLSRSSQEPGEDRNQIAEDDNNEEDEEDQEDQGEEEDDDDDDVNLDDEEDEDDDDDDDDDFNGEDDGPKRRKTRTATSKQNSKETRAQSARKQKKVDLPDTKNTRRGRSGRSAPTTTMKEIKKQPVARPSAARVAADSPMDPPRFRAGLSKRARIRPLHPRGN
eukprot:CAMPEP_0184679600 /NCGR_PEP_ID=MMETSP0312-20130426/2441_1 /TAXON_ID=31354 /ORGANISM="Compsopogon coeruleus, Strain SAG 36.94" /LENGTH=210 /DNA_ID=CAMNT_0027129143 /DNA_START=219 /DNA_END=851 /DNA_ORIENTATION=+